jgi:hypothetical protein
MSKIVPKTDKELSTRLEKKEMMMLGNIRMEEAKMTGMTPAVFSFRGRKVLDPWN